MNATKNSETTRVEYSAVLVHYGAKSSRVERLGRFASWEDAERACDNHATAAGRTIGDDGFVVGSNDGLLYTVDEVAAR